MTRMKSLALGFAMTLAVLLGSLATAQAQNQYPPGYGPPPGYYAPPPPGVYRQGFFIGGALGFGGIEASPCGAGYCGVAFAGEIHLGGMLNPRMGLEGDFWLNTRGISNSDGQFSHSISTLALQYWATPQLWLKGGIGVGHVQTTSDSLGLLEDETGLALMGAVGFELAQGPHFALDLQFRLGRGVYDGADLNNYGFLIGLNWY